MKHFKDDKNRQGQGRSINEPYRHNNKLRGWNPKTTTDGRIGWTTPAAPTNRPKTTAHKDPSTQSGSKNSFTPHSSATTSPSGPALCFGT